jgi:hypothetical protein
MNHNQRRTKVTDLVSIERAVLEEALKRYIDNLPRLAQEGKQPTLLSTSDTAYSDALHAALRSRADRGA